MTSAVSVRSRGTSIAARVLGFGVIIASLIAAGWLWYSRPFAEAKRVGIDGRQLWRNGRCHASLSEANCMTALKLPVVPRVLDAVSIDPWTRRFLRASRTWRAVDSAGWIASLDSIRRKATAAGAQAISCDRSATGFAITDAWTIDDRELRLYADPGDPHRVQTDRWFLSVQLVPPRSAGCGEYVTRRRPTVAELDSMLGVWIRERVAF